MNRIRRLTLLGLAVCLFILPTNALAGHHEGPAGHDPGRFVGRLLDQIDADAETRAAIEAIVEESREEGQRLRDEVNTARRELQALMQAGSPDHDAVFAQAEKLGRIETEARIHRLDVMLRVQDELTPEQREQIRGMRHARHAQILESCAEDLTAVCPDSDPADTRDSVRCLMRNRAQVSEACRGALPSWGGKPGAKGRCAGKAGAQGTCAGKHGPAGSCGGKHAMGECSCSCGAPGSCGHGPHGAPPPAEAPAEPETSPAN